MLIGQELRFAISFLRRLLRATTGSVEITYRPQRHLKSQTKLGEQQARRLAYDNTRYHVRKCGVERYVFRTFGSRRSYSWRRGGLNEVHVKHDRISTVPSSPKQNMRILPVRIPKCRLKAGQVLETET